MRSADLVAAVLFVVLAVGVCGCETQNQAAAPAPETHFDKGLGYEAQEDFDKAEGEYRLAIRNNPNDSRAYVNLGLLYAKAGKPGSAQGYYLRATQVNPKDALAYNLLGGMYMRQKEYKRALACYQQALEIDPKYAGAHWNIAAAYRSLGMRQEAADHYRTYIALASPEEEQDLAEAKRYVTALGDE